MRRAAWGRAVALAFGAMLATACSESGKPESSAASPSRDRPRVAVVNHPLEVFVTRIGGDAVDVVFPAPPDVDPAFWSPSPEQVAEIQRADLIVRSGAGYAGWVDRATLLEARLVDAGAGTEDRWIPLDDAVTHSHGPGGEHSHAAVATTLWLDPELARVQAGNVAEALVKVLAGGEAGGAEAGAPDADARVAELRERAAALDADLARLSERLGEVAVALGDRPLVFSHPVYQYLERALAANGRSLHWEPDEPPGEAAWRALDALLASHPARILVWEDEPLPETARLLEERGLRSIVFALGGNRPGPDDERPAEGDWLEQMFANLDRLEAAVRAVGAP